MGCHTWFHRPATDREFQLMKEYAVEDAKNIEEECGLKGFADDVQRSVKTGARCVYGRTWYENALGADNPELGDDNSVACYQGKVYFDCAPYYTKDDEFICGDDRFHDVFRVKNYPRKIIHNRRELRRFLRKRYFELSEEQLNRISSFFRQYKGGIITFG